MARPKICGSEVFVLKTHDARSQEIGGGGSRYAGQSCGELYCSSPPERPSAKFSELHACDFHRPIAHHHALDTLVNESILYQVGEELGSEALGSHHSLGVTLGRAGEDLERAAAGAGQRLAERHGHKIKPQPS